MELNQLQWMAYGGIGLFALGVGAVTYGLASSPGTRAPRLGARGRKRQLAVDESGGFALIEPWMRYLAGLVGRIPLGRSRQRIDKMLLHSGDYLGLTADEFVGLSVLSGLLMAVIGAALVSLMAMTPLVVVFGAVMGALIPYSQVTGEITERQRHINRTLPTAIDIASLCMGAGLDFPGAIRQIVDRALKAGTPLHDELTRLLQELSLGRTRQQALLELADRVPTEPVREFVSAVVQAEEKGNPLSEVLRIQARMLRMRRSVRAEEAASRAGVMMMLPLMLIFAAIVLILLGPFIVGGMGVGF
ncbi:MAG: type II secretion system F family protein [Deltaproteobacteria bacterium]|nr:type II secretion system F family protein [Deltaproteobacteria bacterium]